MNFAESPITISLIIANVIFSLAAFSNAQVLEKTIMSPYLVNKNNEWYRFITSGFIHADYIHLLFNMFTLFFFGQAIEHYFAVEALGGRTSYLALYFLGLIVSDLPSYFKHKTDYNYHSLGASGAVSAVIFAAIIFNPWQNIFIYAALPIPAVLYAILYIVYCVYMSKKGGDNVNHDAHLWGAVFGLAFTLTLIAFLQPWLFTTIWEKLQNPTFLRRV